VVAHELAHSWTGNLVTNASAEHFWLNEGFTVWAERRILEALAGPEVASLQAALGRRALDEALRLFEGRPELTRLRTHLVNVDPDEAFSPVPYEKGYLLVRALEEAAGRPAFDAFLKRYIAAFRFRSITTEEWVAFGQRELPGGFERVDVGAYLERPGVPPGAPQPRSARLERLAQLAGRVPPDDEVRGWTATEWQLFLESLPPGPDPQLVSELDARFQLTGSRNAEVLVAWLLAGLRAGWPPALERTRTLLGEVGRMKYLKPLYAQLARVAATRALAHALFARYAERYHPIARTVVQAILAKG
jgi:leukotriene-A4 hydrolase